MSKYEYLGRYAEAYDEYESLKRQLGLSAAQIGVEQKRLSWTQPTCQLEVSDIVENLLVLVARHKELHLQFIHCVERLNQYAELCGKARICLKVRFDVSRSCA